VSPADRVWLRASRGDVVLAVRCGEQGPVVSIAGASIEITAGSSSFVAAEVRVRVAGDASIEVAGALAERVAGSAHHEATGVHTLKARAARVEAVAGDLVVLANDDVSIEGARVLLQPEDS
jgi:hypothetical protein